MSYYPKEGLITLHQAQNPPISQAITEELNKPGYGEFITETELSNELNPINQNKLTVQACQPNKNTGCVTLPTWTDNLNGTITINNDGFFMYADNPAGDGCFFLLPALTPATLTPTNGYTNYAYSFYNNDTPIYGLTFIPFTFMQMLDLFR